MTISLRPDQTKGVDDIRASFRENQAVLFRAPCRFGKTVVSAYIAKSASDRRKKVIFACHRDAILQQTAKTFARFGVKHGFIAAGYAANPFALAQVASADTLRNRLDVLKDCALLVVDECHLWNSRTRKLIIDAAKEAGAKVLGLSATPIRLDGKPLADLFDDMVLGPCEADLIEAGNLARYRAFAPHRPDLSGVKTRMGDYVTADVEDKLDKPAIHGDAVATWKKYAEGLRTVVYAISRAHGKHVLDAYLAAGVKAAYIDGETPKQEQLRVANGLADGLYDVIVSVELMTTGYDLGSLIGRDVTIQCVQLLRPSKSLQLAIQMMMRCMTPWEGVSVILDHVNIIMNADGTTNHGFPDDEREWSLEGREGARKEGVAELNIKNCSSCFGAYRSSLPRCPHCQSDAVVKERRVLEIEGELAEIQRVARAKKLVRSARDLDSVALACVENGYKTGWIVARMAALGKPVKYNTASHAWMDAKVRQAYWRGELP